MIVVDAPARARLASFCWWRWGCCFRSRANFARTARLLHSQPVALSSQRYYMGSSYAVLPEPAEVPIEWLQQHDAAPAIPLQSVVTGPRRGCWLPTQCRRHGSPPISPHPTHSPAPRTRTAARTTPARCPAQPLLQPSETSCIVYFFPLAEAFAQRPKRLPFQSSFRF